MTVLPERALTTPLEVIVDPRRSLVRSVLTYVESVTSQGRVVVVLIQN